MREASHHGAVVNALKLHGKPKQVLADRAWIWEYVPRAAPTFGGGTILAARWHHRDSTDVDLLCNNAEWASMDLAGLDEQCRQRLHKGDLVHFQRTTDAIGIFSSSGSGLTIGRSPDLTADSICCDENCEGMKVHSSSEILARKLGKRMSRSDDTPIRDAYDIAVASMVDARALEVALAAVPSDKLEVVRRRLLFKNIDIVGKPLANPAHGELADASALSGVAGNVIHAHLSARRRGSHQGDADRRIER